MSELKQRINFYEDSFRKPVIVFPLKQLILGVAVVVGALLALTALDWSRTLQARDTLAQMESSRDKLEASIERLQKQVDSIVLNPRLELEEKQLQAGLQSKRKFLHQLQSQGDTHGVLFSGYLQALANMDNASIWLTKIIMQAPGPDLSLYGITDEPKAIPGYVADLKNEPSFQGFGFRVFNLERMEENNRFLTFSVSTQHDEQPAN